MMITKESDYGIRIIRALKDGEQMTIYQICLDDVTKKKNAELKPFVFEDRERISGDIISEILEAYRARRAVVPMNLLPGHGNADTTTGVSKVSLKKFLGGYWKPLIDLIVFGDIKGVAGAMGCSNLTAGGHDVLTVELISRDILVLTASCSSGGLENCGLMTPDAAKLAGPKLRAVCESLGIPPVLNFGPCLAIGRLEMVATQLAQALNVNIPDLPLVLSAAQWLDEQALTEDMKELTGDQVSVNGDARQSADILEQIIEDKRKHLNI